MNFSKIIIALIMVLSSSICLGWGQLGHRLIAQIAEDHLSTVAHWQILVLLQDEPNLEQGHELADIASWADKWRYTRAGHVTAPWHYDDREVCGFQTYQCSQRGCLQNALKAQLTILANPSRPSKERAIALKWVVHLVGDLHQPLHEADDHDQGGNAVKVVTPSGQITSLHRLWDVDLVEDVADQLGSAPLTIQSLPKPNLQQWIDDSHHWAVLVAYGDLPGFQCNHSLPNQPLVLTTAYMHEAQSVVRKQLVLAGIHLAQLLNQTLNAELDHPKP